MMTESQQTGHLFGLEQGFELEPRWGSPLFEDDHVLELSNHKQTVRIHLAFTEFNRFLLGRASTRPTDDLDPRDSSTAMTDLADLHLDTSHLDALTDGERQHANTLLKATLPLTDLQPFHANVFGVSRKHAVVEKDGGHIVLTDLNSSNGTRLNGTPLLPMRRCIIRHGDALQLGALQLRVRFCKSQESDQSATKS